MSTPTQDTTATRRDYHLRRFTELGGQASAPNLVPGAEVATVEPPQPVVPHVSVRKKAVKAYFRWRHQLVPGGATAATWTAAAIMHGTHADPRIAALSVVIGGGLAWGINRRKIDKRWKRTYLAASTGYGALLAHMVATHGAMWAGAGDAWLFAGAVAVGLPWTYRHRIRWQPGRVMEEPAAAIAGPVPGAEWLDSWHDRVAAMNGPLPGSMLEDWQEVPGGWTATIVLASGSTEDAVARTKSIGAKLRLSAGTIIIEPTPDGALHKARIFVLPDNPLQAVRRWPGPTLDVATGISRLGLYIDGQPVQYRHYRPGSGPIHDLISGSTDSGKSTAVGQLLAEELHSGVIVSWVIDPQGGMSLPDWQNSVDRYARNIAEARDLLKEGRDRMYARGDMLGALKWTDEKGRPRPGVGSFTPGDPRHGLMMLSITIDEADRVLKDADCRQYVEEMVNMSRKTGIKLRLVSHVPLMAGIGNSQDIADGVKSGNVLVLRTGVRLTGQTAFQGSLPVDPCQLPKEFPDGTSTGGLGFFQGPGSDRATTMRVDYVDDMFHWATTGRAGVLEPFTPPVESEAGATGAEPTGPGPGAAPAADLAEATRSRQQAADAALKVLADGEWHEKSEVMAAMVHVTKSPRTVGHALKTLTDSGWADHPGDRKPYRITEAGLARLAEIKAA